MMRYVQHKSGHGEKWLMAADQSPAKDSDFAYLCYGPGNLLTLPKSEYVECEPPKQWMDVTADCEMNGRVLFWRQSIVSHSVFDDDGYLEKDFRLRKIDVCAAEGQNLLNRWAFIVERLQ